MAESDLVLDRLTDIRDAYVAHRERHGPERALQQSLSEVLGEDALAVSAHFESTLDGSKFKEELVAALDSYFEDQPTSPAAQSDKRPWRAPRAVTVIGLLLVFFPLGLMVMWQQTDWKKSVKWATTITTGLVAVLVIVAVQIGSPAEEVSAPSSTRSLSSTARVRQPARTAFAVSTACARAFEAAASVSEFQDAHEDLFPAYSACNSVEEWRAADELYPDAIDGVDPVRYAMTVCAENQAELGRSAICRIVDRSSDTATTTPLTASGETGLLGAPLPTGAELVERTPGDPVSGADPSERYAIAATQSQIAAFFDAETAKAGWSKRGSSTSAVLIFQRGDLMLGVIIDSSAGTFTLRGS